MKRLFSLIIMISITTIVTAQCEETPRISAIGVSYIGMKSMPVGVGIEAGGLANESNFSVLVGVMFGANAKEVNKEEGQKLPPNVAMYMDFGYRILRIDYTMSWSVHAGGLFDFNKALDLKTGTKLLFPVGYKAISLEGFYILKRQEPGIKATMYFPI